MSSQQHRLRTEARDPSVVNNIDLALNFMTKFYLDHELTKIKKNEKLLILNNIYYFIFLFGPIRSIYIYILKQTSS